MRVLLTLAFKDLRILLADRMGMIFTVFFPLVYAVFFGLIFSGGGEGGRSQIPVALVDADSTARSIAFVESLAVSEELRVVYHSDLEQARQSVRRGSCTAMILLPTGFGDRLGRFMSGDPAELQIGVDPSRKAEAGMLQAVLFQTAAEFMQLGFLDLDTQRQDLAVLRDTLRVDEGEEDLGYLLTFFDALDLFLAEEQERVTENDENALGSAEQEEANWGGFTPLKVEELSIQRERSGPPNAFTVSFPQGVVWGLLGATAGFALGLVLERRRGTLRRLLASPLGWTKILGGRALACFFFCLIMSFLLILVGALFFGVQVQQPGLMLLVLLAIALCFTGVMMITASLGRTEASVGGIGWGMNLLMAMLGGGMVPLFFMPHWMQQVGVISPVRWAVLGIEGCLWRGFTLSELLLPIGVLVTIGLGCLGLGVTLLKRIGFAGEGS